MIARAIHAHGANAYAPFIKVDCSTPSPEDLEQQLFGMVNKRPSSGAPERRSLERIDRHSRLIDAAGGILFLENVVELPARGGLYPADHFRLDRRAWESLKSWGHTGLVREPVSLEVEVDREMSLAS